MKAAGAAVELLNSWAIRLSGRTRQLDSKTLAALWLRLRQGLSPGDDGNRGAADLPEMVLVISTGRVGTETLAAALHGSPQVVAYHEPEPKCFALSRLAYQTRHDQDMSGWIVDTFVDMRRALLENARLRDRVYVETSPQVTFVSHPLTQHLPTVKVIHLVRNPESVIASGLSRGWYQGHRADAQRLYPDQYAAGEAARLWDQWSPAEKIAWNWMETNRFAFDLGEGFLSDRYFRVQSEMLFSSPNLLVDLCKFMNVAAPRAERTARVLTLQLNSGNAMEAHRGEAKEAIKSLKPWLSPVANKLGY